MKGIEFRLIIVIAFVLVTLVNGCAVEKTPVEEKTPTVEKAPVQIQVDASRVVGVLDSTLWANVGTESLYGDATDERLWPFWEQVRQTRTVKYVRFHNLFSDGIRRLGGCFGSGQQDVQKLLSAEDISVELAGTGLTSSVYSGCRIYTEDSNGEPELDFWHLDHVFDLLLSAGVKPIVECDYMPDALSEGQPLRNYSGGLVNTPDDYTKWRELIYQTVKHCIDRYGVDEVRSWYWEMWNEPDLANYFIDGVTAKVPPNKKQAERLLKMYDYFADGARAADDQIRVGGPAINGHPEWLEFFLEHCTTGTNYATGDRGSPLDFISWHEYGTLDGIEEKSQIRQEITGLFPLPVDCQLLVDEWGHRGMESAVYTSYEAAFLCKLLQDKLDGSSWRPDLILRWSRLATTGFNTGYKPLTVWVSGRIVPLPIMNAYTMLGKMGKERLALAGNSEDYRVYGLASRTDKGIQILLYRFLELLEGDGSPVEIDLTVDGLPDTCYWLKHYRIDSKHSNATTTWQIMGQPATLRADQLQQLESDSQLQLLAPPSLIDTEGGRAEIRLNLPYNGVSLLVFGEESGSPFIPGDHINRVLAHEAMYRSAQQKLLDGDTQGARLALEELIIDCVPEDLSASNPHCFWGQKALFSLGKLEDASGSKAAADLVWQRLLRMTLNDTDRLILLQARLKYLGSGENAIELNSVKKELEIVRARLKVFADWAIWSDAPTN